MPLEVAIRKMTSFPAQTMNLQYRGMLKEGNWADVVIFDSDTIIDNATYMDPHQYATGIDYVLVNGEIVMDHGVHTNKKPGQILRRPN